MKLVLIFLLAILLDFLLGDPHSIPHPVIGIGKWISFAEKKIRKYLPSHLKLGGGLLLFSSLALVSLVILTAQWIFFWIHPLLGYAFWVYGLYTSLAAKCLSDEVKRVLKTLQEGDAEKSRKELSYLVGRDTKNLSKGAVRKALLETTAENTVDGVLAPLCYIFIGFLLGQPLLLVYLYKTVNTLDSMVGYQQEYFKEIGFFSAKLDDVLNFIPARFGSLVMLLSGGLLGLPVKEGFRVFKRDRKNHKSPNSGHPESVVAGLLGVQLGGTNSYFGETVVKKTIGDAKTQEEISEENVYKTIHIMYGAEVILASSFLLLLGGIL